MTEVTPDTSTRGGAPPPPPPPTDTDWRKEYWSRNLRLMVILLSIWFIVSFGFGILLVEPLNKIVIAGFPLGFWFAQQGSIYVFVILIFVNAVLADRQDREFNMHETAETTQHVTAEH